MRIFSNRIALARLIVICLLYFFGGRHSLLAQNPLSPSASRYAGLLSGQVNPASLSFNVPTWTVHLGSTQAYFQNNLVSMQRLNVLGLIAGNDVSIELDNQNNRNAGPINADVLIQDHIDKPLTMQLGSQVMPIGLFFQFNKHAFGLSNQLRQNIYWDGFGARGFRQIWEGIRYEPLRDSLVSSPGMKFQADLYIETSLSYAYRFYETRREAMSAGVSVKLLNGLQTYQLDMTGFDYRVRFDSVFFTRFEGTYGRAVGNQGLGSGLGLAFDLGFNYVKIDQQAKRQSRTQSGIRCFNFAGKLRVRKPVPDYLWKLGVSWLDLGLINYDAPFFAVNSSGRYSTLGRFFTVGEPDFDADFLGELANNGVVAGTPSFSVGAPTALSVQFDGKIYPGVYLFAGIIQRTPMFGQFSMRRTNTLTVIPRVEHPLGEFAIPVTLTEYRYFNLGLSARIGPLAFGTDRFGTLFGLQRFSGADAWFSLNLFEFWRF